MDRQRISRLWFLWGLALAAGLPLLNLTWFVAKLFIDGSEYPSIFHVAASVTSIVLTCSLAWLLVRRSVRGPDWRPLVVALAFYAVGALALAWSTFTTGLESNKGAAFFSGLALSILGTAAIAVLGLGIVALRVESTRPTPANHD